jgi:hypothetical protein
VSVVVSVALDCKQSEAKLYQQLFNILLQDKLSSAQVTNGYARLVCFALFLLFISFSLAVPTLVDLVLDVPLCSQTFAHYLQLAFSKSKLELSDLSTILDSLVGEEEQILLKILTSFLSCIAEAEVLVTPFYFTHLIGH